MLCLSGCSLTSVLIFLANVFQIAFNSLAQIWYLGSFIRFNIDGLSCQSGGVHFSSSSFATKFWLTKVSSCFKVGRLFVEFMSFSKLQTNWPSDITTRSLTWFRTKHHFTYFSSVTLGSFTCEWSTKDLLSLNNSLSCIVCSSSPWQYIWLKFL